ncbi:MAG: methyltransferase domain-containing protein [Rhodanobacteraceae bacterium]|nr:class I SAM-dependent methyltransferase [Pseudomonadota bacterium]
MKANVRDEASMVESNRRFYDKLWREAKLIEPRRFNTWPLVSELCAASTRRLEIAPGLRPRLPLSDTVFVDLSAPALRALRAHGAHVINGLIGALPLPTSAFDFICAFDIVEHVADDNVALAELARVAAPGATLLLSVPLHLAAWNAFDDFVGHCRRYEPAGILAKLGAHDLHVERSAIYGMQPRSSRLLNLGMWFLVHHRSVAMNWYNRVFMPLGLRTQKPLRLTPGMVDTQGVDEVLLVCRKTDTVQ